MFEVGEYVVFGTDGVCTVEAIGSLDIEGVSKDRQYYTLAPIGKSRNNRIFAPVEGKRVVMRRILTREEAQNLVKSIGDIECINVPDERKREETYKAVMQSCDCVKIVGLIKEIDARRKARTEAGKKLPSVDERYCSMAENTLLNELSVPLKLDKEQVRDYIMETVGRSGEAFYGQ